MAAQVTVPGIGPVRRDVLYGIGGVAALAVGYAWWRSRADADVPLTGEEAVGYGDDYSATAVGDLSGAQTTGVGGGATTVASDVPLPPRDNAEWTQRATSMLGDIGYEPAAVAAAIGNYLARKPLSAAQADIINTARAMVGPPPLGEFPVTLTPATPTTPAKPAPAKAPGRPSGFAVRASTADTVTLGWSPVSGATSYRVYMDGRAGFVTVKTPTATITHLWPRRRYTFRVRGMNAAGAGTLAGPVAGRTK